MEISKDSKDKVLQLVLKWENIFNSFMTKEDCLRFNNECKDLNIKIDEIICQMKDFNVSIKNEVKI